MTYEDGKNARLPQSHSLSLSDRRRLTVSGVEDVESFDEDAAALVTGGGTLTVRGSGLKLEKLSLDGGELVVEGRIDSLDYSDNAPARRGWLGKLLG
jgi:sporulation protein YabP